MDLQEQTPLGLANHMAASVKRRARPWRAIIALTLAAVAIAVDQEGVRLTTKGHLAGKIVTASAAAAFCLFAAIALVALAGKARELLNPRAGTGHAAVVRYTILLVGGIITFTITLALLKIPVGQLVVGGALTTILIGIAAQQSLGNVFAGIVLLLSRPFAVGDAVLIRSGPLGGSIQGTVTEIGIAYVRLETDEEVLHLPNSQVLASGVGHARPALGEPAGHDIPAVPGGASGEGPVSGGTTSPGPVSGGALPGGPVSGSPV